MAPSLIAARSVNYIIPVALLREDSQWTQTPLPGARVFSLRASRQTGELAELDAQIEAALREAVDEEVNRRLAARGLEVEVQQANGDSRQIRHTRNHLMLTSGDGG